MEDGGIVHLAVKFGGTLKSVKSLKSLKFGSSADEGLMAYHSAAVCF